MTADELMAWSEAWHRACEFRPNGPWFFAQPAVIRP